MNENGVGYVIDAVWTGGETEALAEVYMTPEAAQRWVNERSGDWIGKKARRPKPV